MAASPAASFCDLPPELFPEIIEHLPLVYRPSTLLSLALTCHCIHDAIFPELLYDTVRLEGEDQSLTTLNTLIERAEVLITQDIQKQGNASLSHCIHHICLDSSIETPMNGPNSLDALQKLIEVDGLRHLSSLTLHVIPEWDGTEGDDETEPHLKLPSSFFTSLETKCPNLKRVQISDFFQEFGKEWIEPHIFKIKHLTSIRIESDLLNYPSPTINLSKLSSNLHTLELRLVDYIRGDLIDFDVLLGCTIPNLRALILDRIAVTNPLSTNSFWRAHPGIERLELGRRVLGNWFADFEAEMLPNLKYLQVIILYRLKVSNRLKSCMPCNVNHALVLLPQVSNSLINLYLWGTYNAQGPYLLRVVSPGRVLPALRSLGIHRNSGNSLEPQEGHRWRENENGDVPDGGTRKSARKFDANYIMSLSKAAPNLEELELMGTSDETLESLTTSLSWFSKLKRLTLSGGIDSHNKPFFARSTNWEDYAGFDTYDSKHYGKYASESFDEAARDLANGCCTLDVVTMGNIFAKFSIMDGLSRKIVRKCDGGEVKQLIKTRALGNIISREDEW
ncbi:hypothetical protein M413DRAFT_31439 [Hebeloma cylindrosporum]|uniref:F-box domain-containing protein n=1 Tax=Hebeloma cylindrosporum TaxID=76867 RepID=A0A0C3BJC1_HEBCY|nr:hypothetical protein M413DRAFT_31439 [Hebeloma cylindrosporum h7]